MNPLIFALISYIGWGTGDIFGTIATRKIGAYATTWWVYTIVFVICSFYAPFVWTEVYAYTIPLLLFNLFLGALYIGGNTLLNEAFRIGNPSLVGVINASFAAWTVIFSVLLLREPITPIAIGIIAIIFIGIIFCMVDFSQLHTKQLLRDRGVKLAILCALTFGFYFTFTKLIVNQVGWFWPNYISVACFPLIYFYMKWKHIPMVSPFTKKSLIPIAASAILLRSADFAFNIGLSFGLSSVIAPIAGSFPTLFVVLAFLLFKDPIRKQQIIGIVITLFGIVLLNIVDV